MTNWNPDQKKKGLIIRKETRCHLWRRPHHHLCPHAKTHRHISLRKNSRKDEVFSLIAKFNDALNSMVARANQHILTVNSCHTGSHFTHLGELSERGKQDFWSEIDHLLERFDRK